MITVWTIGKYRFSLKAVLLVSLFVLIAIYVALALYQILLGQLLVDEANSGNYSGVVSLLAKGADVNATDLDLGVTPLMFACDGHYIDVVQVLINKHADVNMADKRGDTALIHASWNGWTDIVQLLLSHGANIEAVDNNGYDALLRAADNGNLETVKLLVGHGASIYQRNSLGQTAEEAAKHHGFHEIADYLHAINTKH